MAARRRRPRAKPCQRDHDPGQRQPVGRRRVPPVRPRGWSAAPLLGNLLGRRRGVGEPRPADRRPRSGPTPARRPAAGDALAPHRGRRDRFELQRRPPGDDHAVADRRRPRGARGSRQGSRASRPTGATATSSWTKASGTSCSPPSTSRPLTRLTSCSRGPCRRPGTPDRRSSTTSPAITPSARSPTSPGAASRPTTAPPGSLAAQADDDALAFLATAEAVATDYHLTVGSAFETDYGTALARSGQVPEALAHYENALRLERERIGKARIHEHVARVYFAQTNGTLGLQHARDGLAELGKPLPSSNVLVVLSTLWKCFLGLVLGVTRIGFGGAKRGKREQVRLECRLLKVAGDSADLEHRSFLSVGVALRRAAARQPSRSLPRVRGRLCPPRRRARSDPARQLRPHRRPPHDRVAERTGDQGTIVHAEAARSHQPRVPGRVRAVAAGPLRGAPPRDRAGSSPAST